MNTCLCSNRHWCPTTAGDGKIRRLGEQGANEDNIVNKFSAPWDPPLVLGAARILGVRSIPVYNLVCVDDGSGLAGFVGGDVWLGEGAPAGVVETGGPFAGAIVAVVGFWATAETLMLVKGFWG